MNFPRDLKTNWKYVLTAIVIVTAVVGGGILWSSAGSEFPLTEFPGGSERFRNLTVQFVGAVAEDYFDGQPGQYPEELEIRGNWELDITIYHRGKIEGEGVERGKDEILSLVLEEATVNALEEGSQSLDKENIKEVRFLVSFSD
jgi:hypothetical protein